MTVDEMPLTSSYTRGPSRTLLDLTIGELLHRTADRCGDRLAVASRHQGRRFTWAELNEQTDRVARGLYSLGTRRGDRVGVWSTNSIEWLMMHMGCRRAGTALVQVDPAYRSHELHAVHAAEVRVARWHWPSGVGCGVEANHLFYRKTRR